MLCRARRRVWPGTPSSSRCSRKNSGERGLTGFTRSGRRNGTSGAPWNRLSTTRSSCRRLMSLGRRWRTSWWRRSGTARYSYSRAGHRSAQDLFFPSFSQAPCAFRGADGGTVGGSADDRILLIVTRIVEQNVDIPVPHGRGRGRGGLGLLTGQSSTAYCGADHPAATTEQLVDIPVPRGGRVLHPASSSSGLPGTANPGVFRTFPRGKKVRRWVRTLGRNWVRTLLHPRRRLS